MSRMMPQGAALCRCKGFVHTVGHGLRTSHRDHRPCRSALGLLRDASLAILIRTCLEIT
jgi:hypothetical protein